MADKKSSVGELKVNVDVSEAIKGLKAVQREAKKATAALKELEEETKKHNKNVLLETLANLHNIPKETLEKTKIKYTPLSKVEPKPEVIVFDEMHAMCPRCGSTNREINEIKSAPKELYAREIKCLDCGYLI